MKRKHIIKSLVAVFLMTVIAVGCDSYNDAVLDGVGNTRVFSPVGVTAKVRNQTSVELNWTANAQADHYVIEFSADDPNFTTIFKTVEVTSAQLPVTVALEGETLYSIRVKAVSEGNLEESKWTVTTANTLSEQLFLPVQDTDIAAKTAILRWVANSNVTKIVLTPGDVTHTITAEEKVAGIATITGLTPEISYQANLFNGTKKRGATTFTTGIDVGDGILVKNTDDLIQVVENAASGAKLFLEEGNYKSIAADGVTQSTELVLKKSITISGISGHPRPVLHYKITANAGVSNVSLLNLELDGTGLATASTLNLASTTANYGDILFSNCKIYNYDKSLITSPTATYTPISKINSITIDNCIVTKVNTTASADFIDFRFTHVQALTLKNSTFDTCSAGRDFIRIDKAGLTGTGLTTTVLISSCTLNNVSDITTGSFRKILFVRFASQAVKVENTLITSTSAVYTNSTDTSAPTFVNNNYFVTPNLNIVGSSNRPDSSGTTLDPGYTNAATGDFTISNQTLKDNNVGDPRWIK
ncbi:DUF5123 domain-containing protein [Flavobacterium gyeonganense]|uniref:DUF5123 domain-containing protein n=1 Tax=Flavobacterium gyeonganense TaxID=1310418 RepID=A0ABV5H8R9_9FLAO|nr:DUF5123 domain-containing protein [Flavobacterium gyeonganense]